MREIKYRAFVKRYEVSMLDHVSNSTEPTIIRNEMVPVTGLHFFEGQELTEISIDTQWYGGLQNILLADHGTGIELMQYIGLKDKNGTEICEEDIVRYKWGGVLSYAVIKQTSPEYHLISHPCAQP